MHVELYPANSTAAKDAITITDDLSVIDLASNRPSPHVYVDAEEVEAKTGHATSAEMAIVEIIGADGKVGRFWIGARLNKQGRPVVDVSTNVGDRTTTKKLTGAWR
jgi:hypothetical protein